MFVSNQCNRLHESYSLSERHSVFWNTPVDSSAGILELKQKRLELYQDQQITVKHKGDYDFDVTKKLGLLHNSVLVL